MPADPIRSRHPLTDDAAVNLLATGAIEVLGRMPWSSNATFLVDLSSAPASEDACLGDGGGEGSDEEDGPLAQAIYKPVRGERPLWDFPTGLHRRERAAYILAQHLGWDLVPPTVIRDGPLGVGSFQLVVPTDYREHYFTLVEQPAHHQVLQRLCALDVVINSTDRKSGHCLLGDDGRIYAIDNGLSFHEDFKLRTVIWEWSEQRLPSGISDALTELLDCGPPDEVADLLDPDEGHAVLARTAALVRAGRFPSDPSGRRYPWPLV